MSDTNPASGRHTTGDRTLEPGHSVVQDGTGWSVRAGVVERTSQLYGTRAEAIAVAREAVSQTGGMLTVRSPEGRFTSTYTVGREPFRKISAVEGIVPTAAAEARAELFARTRLSSEQRLQVIIAAHRSSED